jgi:DNA-binding response OmpR family regulator
VATHRISIVEDEPMIAMMVEDFLEELGWHVAVTPRRRIHARQSQPL